MALLIGRWPHQQLTIGQTLVTVTDVGERTVAVRLTPGGAHTFTTPFERLTLSREGAELQARPHPHRSKHGAAQLRITAPRDVPVARLERGHHTAREAA
jgi:hypothetical protein